MYRSIILVLTLILAGLPELRAQIKPNVVTSVSIIEDIARNIAGDKVSYESIVPIGGDPHIYEPTPSDVMMVQSADLILVNGLTFEGWINELIDNSGSIAPTETVTKGIQVLSNQKYENSADPHAWMDASNGKIYARNIARALIELDPNNENFYRQNLNRYIKELEILDQYIFDKIKEIPGAQRVLITTHDAFQYYGRRYGIRLEALRGVSTDAEAQTSDIQRVAETIRRDQVPAIFVESTINPKVLTQIAQDNEVHIGGSLFADSLGDQVSPASTYLTMLRYNTDVIVQALSGEIFADQTKERINYPFAAVLLFAMVLGFVFFAYKIH